MLTLEMQIAERSGKYPGEALTNLHQFIDVALLKMSLETLNKQSARGIDGETWQSYNEQREERIPALLSAFKQGIYKAPPVRRVFIPKGEGQKRPLGIPTIEDKVLQTAVSRVLTPIYDQVFYENSYGFRSGKTPHQALDRLFQEVSFKGKHYIIDADMENYFGSLNHGCLRTFLDHKIKDGVIRKMLDKWLKAGILEEGQLRYPEEGTPQGGPISPLLSNIYLHYVLDEWFIEEIQPLLKGTSFLIRYADDFLLGFNNKEDAQRVLEVLPKRLGKYSLKLHPEKTKLITLGEGDDKDDNTFDFLGFTHYKGQSRKGKMILKRKTNKKRLARALKRNSEWLKNNRHLPISILVEKMNQKLRGHYGYYGITFNSRSLIKFYEQTKIMLHKWLNRRGGRTFNSWKDFSKIIIAEMVKPKIYHSYRLAKP